MPSNQPATLISGYIPGTIGRIAELHSTYYAQHWGFGLYFEAKVATEMSAFLKAYDAQRDGLWTVVNGDRVEGGIVIDGSHAWDKGAHLRWFILSDALRGSGWGRHLITTAVDFCIEKKYPQIYLWTFEGLHAARHLYESAGFHLVQQHNGRQWGLEVNEQRFVCQLPIKGQPDTP
jgi:GNAT superfamily N-acetyltransferase